MSFVKLVLQQTYLRLLARFPLGSGIAASIACSSGSFVIHDVIILFVFLTILMQQHIFPGAETELEHVLLKKFNVLLGVHLFVVYERSVRRFQVDYVGPNPLAAGSIFPLVRHQSVLQGGVLLRARWVVDGQIAHLPIPANQIATLPVYVHRRQGLLALERVQTPAALGFTRFRRFGILDDYAVDRVGFFCKLTGQGKVRLLLVLRGFVVGVVAAGAAS